MGLVRKRNHNRWRKIKCLFFGHWVNQNAPCVTFNQTSLEYDWVKVETDVSVCFYCGDLVNVALRIIDSEKCLKSQGLPGSIYLLWLLKWSRVNVLGDG